MFEQKLTLMCIFTSQIMHVMQKTNTKVSMNEIEETVFLVIN